jgi:hypothetical protein
MATKIHKKLACLISSNMRLRSIFLKAQASNNKPNPKNKRNLKIFFKEKST